MMRLVLYRPEFRGPVRYVLEDMVTTVKKCWLVNGYYMCPKEGPYSNRVRLCPPELAEKLMAIDAEFWALERRRAEVHEEVWRRADRYRGLGRG